MSSMFINVFHEEPLDKMSLEAIKGGAGCICNGGATFNCECYGSNNFDCICNGQGSSFSCKVVKFVEPEPGPVKPDPNPITRIF